MFRTRYRWPALVVFLTAAAGLFAESAYVQVKETPLRESGSFVAKILATLPYGTEVKVESRSGAWTKVSATGKVGWIHGTALSAKEVALQAGGNRSTAASSQEVALAGKGFNAQVEAEYRSGNPALDYATVDRMEAIIVAPEEMKRFLDEAGLKAEEGTL